MKELESIPSQYIFPSIPKTFHNPHNLIEPDVRATYASIATMPSLSRKRRHSDTEPWPSDKRLREPTQSHSCQMGSAEDFETDSWPTLGNPLHHEAEEDNTMHLSSKNVEALESQNSEGGVLHNSNAVNNLAVEESQDDRIVIYQSAGGTPIYLHEQLATSLRPHQIDGLRFLWKEVAVASPTRAARMGEGAQNSDGYDDDDDDNEYNDSDSYSGGALLAHTMGLGKTVTVIAFLFMLAEAQGTDPERTAHPTLPLHFRVGQHMARVLILVPGGLLTNWTLELKTWAAKFTDQSSCGAKLLNAVYGIRNTLTLAQRVEVLQKWHTSGGILLLGYELFRILIAPKESVHRSDRIQSAIDSYLLKPGPGLVVADEAHAMKNTQSKITRAVREISTRNRIALTASPLSNNLLEFYSLMSWVSPESELGGSVADFRTNFYNPIMNNLSQSEKDSDMEFLDSEDEVDQCELDEALGTANKTLQDVINASGGKIHRRNVDTIKQYLKPKTEFIIRVSLNDKQVSLYNKYINESTAESAMWRLFCLKALCNHPEVFRRIRKRGVGKKRIPEGKIKAPDPVRKSAGSKGVETHVREESVKVTVVLPVPETEGHQPTALLQLEADHTEGSNPESFKPALNITDLPKTESKQLQSTMGETAFTPSKAKTITAASNKFLILFHLLEGFKAMGDKALVFSHSMDTLDLLYTLATTLGFSVLRLDGSIQFHQRQEDLVQFNRGKYDIYLVSTKAGGVGLNLQCANRVIILDNDYSPVCELQAIGRSFRMGQMKEVFVYRFLVEGSVETKIAREKRKKVRLSNIVIDGIWEKRKSYSMDTDHRNVWEPAQKIKVPSVLRNAGSWRGRDTVLDQVVTSTHVITDITVDTYETTSFPPAMAHPDIVDYDTDGLIGNDLNDVDLYLADDNYDDISTGQAQTDFQETELDDYDMTDNE